MPRTYQILADAFLNEGVHTCFALLGDANMNWATAMADGGCRMIYVRHEHNAVAAAMAHARKTGTTGVATTTCGPGLTQVMTALPAAVRASLPLVIFAGEAPLSTPWYNQAIDQAPFVIATGAAYHALHHPARMPEQIRDAFVQADAERRPVVLGVPFDLQDADWPGPLPDLAPSRDLRPVIGPMPPHQDDIARAAARLKSVRRVVVLAGLGATHAAAEAQALADKLDALLATSLPARGLFADDPFSIGIAGGFSTDLGRALLAETDVVIAAGCRLAQHNTDAGKLFAQAHVIQIDTDPRALSQGRIATDSHIRADAALGLAALARAVLEKPRDWRSDALTHRIATTPYDATPRAPEDGLHDPRDVVAALDAALPADCELVNSSGHCSYYFAQMPRRPFARFLTIREFGAIGNGLAFAMGVATARPDVLTVLFDGDGSLLMHIQELETMRRHDMNILICALNDGAYGSEIHKLRAEGLSDAGAVFGRPDFAGIGRGFGICGQRIDDLTDLPSLIANINGPTIWDFHISDRIASPVMQRAHPPKGPH